MSIRVGQQLPDFTVEAYVRDEHAPRQIDLARLRGQWVVLFFYPRDFTFICPTEIRSFAELHGAFQREQAVVLAASTDSYYSHKAWFESDQRLMSVNYPVIADTSQALSRALNILLDNGDALRATYIIDPQGIVRHIQVNDLEVGRNANETLRTLQALRTGQLCQAAWEPGEPTLSEQMETALVKD